MAGGERKRFCERCQHAVHDLSAMTQRQARRLLVKQPRDLCVSYLTNETGEIQFRSEIGRSSLNGLALGLAISVAACSQRTTGSPRPTASGSVAVAVAPAVPAPAAVTSAVASAAPAASTESECDERARRALESELRHPPPSTLTRTAGIPLRRKKSDDPLR
jgi:hypothetical protein